MQEKLYQVLGLVRAELVTNSIHILPRTSTLRNKFDKHTDVFEQLREAVELRCKAGAAAVMAECESLSPLEWTCNASGSGESSTM